MSKIILNNISTNSTTQTFGVIKSDPSGILIQISGDFGGANVAFQSSIYGMAFQDMDGFESEVPSITNVDLRDGMVFRFVISGGADMDINIGVAGGGY